MGRNVEGSPGAVGASSVQGARAMSGMRRGGHGQTRTHAQRPARIVDVVLSSLLAQLANYERRTPITRAPRGGWRPAAALEK